MTSRATISLNFVRYFASRKNPKWEDSKSARYGYIKYYPRHPDEVDPVFEPSKVFLIKLVKPFWGNPWWEKNVLKYLGFGEKRKTPVIVKNTASVCASLWKVKHLVEVIPIQLPDKLPSTDDLNHTYLHSNGTFTVIPKVDSARLEATEKFISDSKRLDREYLKELLRRKWLDGRSNVF